MKCPSCNKNARFYVLTRKPVVVQCEECRDCFESVKGEVKEKVNWKECAYWQ